MIFKIFTEPSIIPPLSKIMSNSEAYTSPLRAVIWICLTATLPSSRAHFYLLLLSNFLVLLSLRLPLFFMCAKFHKASQALLNFVMNHTFCREMLNNKEDCRKTVTNGAGRPLQIWWRWFRDSVLNELCLCYLIREQGPPDLWRLSDLLRDCACYLPVSCYHLSTHPI